MKLVSFTVEKYRSIVKAHRIYTGYSTILIGPNNEGKSNILRALVAGMSVLTRGAEFFTARNKQIVRFTVGRFYNWDVDFPVHLRAMEPDGESSLLLEFELSDAETANFRGEIGSNLNGTLPLRITMGRQRVTVEVAKQGRGGKALTAKSGRIAKFVASRLDFEHIPAIRTAESAQQIVDMLVERELETLEENEEYRDALAKVAVLQRPLLDALATSMKETLQRFLPAVHDVRLQISTENRYRAMRRSTEILVDDGASTRLEFKGDGVQSLAALAMMRHASDRRRSAKSLVIAIEEPESHLHPRAIHELKVVLDDLSRSHQVVLTTHCPLFVDRVDITHNVLVQRGRARPAKSIEEIRTILGVRTADNLQHAELVLVTEGWGDAVILEALLRQNSELLRTAFDNGTIAIDTLAGGTNLSYKLSLLRSGLVLYHCFLDNDDCGRNSYDDARREGLVTDADVNMATCAGMIDSEIEDMLSTEVYSTSIENAYRISLQNPRFRTSRKWSDRLRDTFTNQGKPWNDRVEAEVKVKVAECVKAHPDQALNAYKRGSFDSLYHTLESRLTELAAARE
jgi:hypothetical protein